MRPFPHAALPSRPGAVLVLGSLLAAPAGGLLPAAAQELVPTELRVEPRTVTIDVGETFPWDGFDASVVDADGNPVEGFRISISLTGSPPPFEPAQAGLTGLRPGSGEISLVASGGPEGFRTPEPARVRVEVRPPAVTSVEVTGAEGAAWAGTSRPIGARVVAGGDFTWEDAPVEWITSDPSVATVEEGVLLLHRPGEVTVTAAAGGVRGSRTLEVRPDPVASLGLEVPEEAVRTGDVVPLRAVVRDVSGEPVDGYVPAFALLGDAGGREAGATVYEDGDFVASRPGVYRVTAMAGDEAARGVIRVEPRGVEMDLTTVGAGIVSELATTDLWVFTGADGRDYVYTGTKQPGGKMYAWDVTDAENPVLTDSVLVDARTVNDVKVNEAATLAVITREGASDRRNGIILLDLSDPAHPTVVSEYTETLTGGVHNTFVSGDLVYAVHNGTRDVHIIDVSDPATPREVGRWGLDREGKSLHDVWIEDGLAYVSYWDDGMWIVDVGDGRWGGTPTDPVPVSHIAYPEGNTHVAFPYTNAAGHRYVFVGDEIFGCADCISRSGPHIPPSPRGYVHVMDVSDIENPVEVARYEVPEAGAHNLWVEDDRLYVAYYQAGLRVVDVSGELRGDLYDQGREIAWFPTGAPDGWVPNSPRAWGPQPYGGNIYVSDKHSGLWILRLVPEGEGL